MNTATFFFASMMAIASATPLAAAERVTAGETPPCIDGAISADAVQDLIRKESQRQGADPKLALAVSEQESGYGRIVNSPVGARGPMQLMPATAARYGVTDICDAAQNIRGGVGYLKDLTRLFGGNVFLIVAAYNAGEDRVLRSGGVPPIAETVNYVALVANAYYGFDNALKGGRRRTAALASPEQPAGQVSGVDLLTTGSVSTRPLPDNPSRPQPSSQNGWIGGSVLYVQ